MPCKWNKIKKAALTKRILAKKKGGALRGRKSEIL